MRHRELWRIDVSKEQGGDKRAGHCVTDRASYVRRAHSQCVNDKRGCSYKKQSHYRPGVAQRVPGS